MTEEQDADSKTEEATEKKLHDAVERGDVPVSREVPLLASLSAILVALVFVMPPRAEAFVGALLHFLDDPAGWRLERASDVLALGEVMVIAAVEFLAPIVFLLMVFGVVASVAQNPPRIVPERIMPDLARISPQAGFSRIFGLRGWTEFLKSLTKIARGRRRRRIRPQRTTDPAGDGDVRRRRRPAAAAAQALRRRGRGGAGGDAGRSPRPTSPGRASIGGATSA